MILSGEIGATRTRLAAFETEGNSLKRVVEKLYMSQEHSGWAVRRKEMTRSLAAGVSSQGSTGHCCQAVSPL